MNNFSPTGAATNRFTPSMFLTPQGNTKFEEDFGPPLFIPNFQSLDQS